MMKMANNVCEDRSRGNPALSFEKGQVFTQKGLGRDRKGGYDEEKVVRGDGVCTRIVQNRRYKW